MRHGKEIDVYSHQGKKLEKHLFNTLSLSQEIATQYHIPLKNEDKICILLHDIAKSHPDFQKKLLQGRGMFGHAEPSSALVFYCVKNLLHAEAVRRHHSQIKNISEVEKFWGNEWDYNDTKKVIEELYWWPGAREIVKTITSKEVTSWVELLGSEDDWDEIMDIVDYYQIESEKVFPFEWLRLRLIYSLLVTADRYEAAVGEDISFSPLLLEIERLDSYRQELCNKPLAEWRGMVREKVIFNAEKVMCKPGVYTLTLPTGAGKTLIGLELAIRAAKRFGATGIIYVLPFVSLVEQNAGIAQKLFSDRCPVLEDHHLSSYHVKSKENESEEELVAPLQRFVSFFRYWHTPVVVTTLAKMWEIIYSPRANDTMSFHRLSKAVVILDEPQAIPPGCWDGFGKTLELLADKLNTTFILMTATQPEIVDGKEITPCPIHFPQVRHEFYWSGKMTIPEIISFLDRRRFFDCNYLLVLNTRKAALKMYIELKKRGLESFFLSRWVTPFDRQGVLKELKRKEAVNREEYIDISRCLVATQVIEAGMDLDFDVAFRDLGPLDCIIQVAGRCNRNLRKENGIGKVYIAELYDENGPFSMIYDKVLIEQTRSILNEKVSFDEGDSREIVSEYYLKIKENVSSEKLWENICQGMWGEYTDIFQDKTLNEVMLIVDPKDEFGIDLEFLNQPIGKSDDLFMALEKRKKIFQKLSLHSVPVPKKEIDKWFDKVAANIITDDSNASGLYYVSEGIWVVRGMTVNQIYRDNIGFVPVEIADILDDEFNFERVP